MADQTPPSPPADVPETPDTPPVRNYIGRSVSALLRSTQRSLSPWMQRLVESPAEADGPATGRRLVGGGPLRVGARKMGASGLGLQRLSSRIQRQAARATAWHGRVSMAGPARVDRFVNKVASRFPPLALKYAAQPMQAGGEVQRSPLPFVQAASETGVEADDFARPDPVESFSFPSYSPESPVSIQREPAPVTPAARPSAQPAAPLYAKDESLTAMLRGITHGPTGIRKSAEPDAPTPSPRELSRRAIQAARAAQGEGARSRRGTIQEISAGQETVNRSPEPSRPAPPAAPVRPPAAPPPTPAEGPRAAEARPALPTPTVQRKVEPLARPVEPPQEPVAAPASAEPEAKPSIEPQAQPLVLRRARSTESPTVQPEAEPTETPSAGPETTPAAPTAPQQAAPPAERVQRASEPPSTLAAPPAPRASGTRRRSQVQRKVEPGPAAPATPPAPSEPAQPPAPTIQRRSEPPSPPEERVQRAAVPPAPPPPSEARVEPPSVPVPPAAEARPSGDMPLRLVQRKEAEPPPASEPPASEPPPPAAPPRPPTTPPAPVTPPTPSSIQRTPERSVADPPVQAASRPPVEPPRRPESSLTPPPPASTPPTVASTLPVEPPAVDARSVQRKIDQDMPLRASPAPEPQAAEGPETPSAEPPPALPQPSALPVTAASGPAPSPSPVIRRQPIARPAATIQRTPAEPVAPRSPVIARRPAAARSATPQAQAPAQRPLAVMRSPLTYATRQALQPAPATTTAALPQARVQRAPDVTQAEPAPAELPLQLWRMPYSSTEARVEATADVGEIESSDGAEAPTAAYGGMALTPAPARPVQRKPAKAAAPVRRKPSSSIQRKTSGTKISEGSGGLFDNEAPASKAPDLADLARKILPLIKRMLAVERERR